MSDARGEAGPLAGRTAGRGGCGHRCGSSCAPRPAAPCSCWPRRSPRSPGRTWTRPRTRGSGDAGVGPGRRRGHHAGSARLGQRRPDDAVLLRRRAGGAPRVRHGRVARPAAGRAAAGRRARRDARAGRHLPGGERGASDRARLGHRDVDGHGVRARRPRAGRPQLPGPAPRVPAHRHRRGRRHSARGDRDLLQRGRLDPGAADGPRDLRGDRPDPRRLHPAVRRLPAAGRGHVGGAGVVRRGAGGRRPGHGPAHLRAPRRPHRPGTRDGGLPPLPRTAHTRIRALGPDPGGLGDLAERAAATAVPPVDELRDRPAVRTRQRRDQHQRRLSGPRVHLAGHAGHPDRLRRRQADRAPRLIVAGHVAQPGSAEAARRLGRGRGTARSRASASPWRC